MGSKFNLEEFFRQPDAVAAIMPASKLFGLLTRSLNLPAQWAALVTRETGDHVMIQAGAVVDGRDADEVLFVRTSAFDAAVHEDGLITKDKFQTRAEGTLRLSLIPERAELLSFRQVVLGSFSVAKAADVARFLEPAIRAALVRVAGEREAGTLVDAGSSDAVSKVLADAVEGPCFSAGLTLSARPEARFQSQALEQVREAQAEVARRRREHEAAREVQQALERAQGEHLDHLAGLLGRLRDLAEASPDVELGDLLRTFSEQQRGEIYEALFKSEPIASHTGWFVVAVGDEALFFEPESLEAPSRRLAVSGAVGQVRSVQTITDPGGHSVLLLGAATGVYRLPIGAAEPDLTLSVANAPPVRGGFNAAIVVGDRVLATHSELGLCEWRVREPDVARLRFESMTRGAKVVRNAAFFEGDLFCSIDDRILRWPADDPGDRPTHIYTGARAAIAALVPTSAGLFAGTSEGEVLHWPAGRDTEPSCLHTGSRRPVESLWLLYSHGVRRLVFTDTSVYVHARVLGDNFAARYEAGGQTIRRVEIAPDVLVATNDLRDRLILWRPGEPARPFATIGVSRMCQRSVQDVCLVPKA
jgi:hypothetical protein